VFCAPCGVQLAAAAPPLDGDPWPGSAAARVPAHRRSAPGGIEDAPGRAQGRAEGEGRGRGGSCARHQQARLLDPAQEKGRVRDAVDWAKIGRNFHRETPAFRCGAGPRHQRLPDLDAPGGPGSVRRRFQSPRIHPGPVERADSALGQEVGEDRPRAVGTDAPAVPGDPAEPESVDSASTAVPEIGPHGSAAFTYRPWTRLATVLKRGTWQGPWRDGQTFDSMPGRSDDDPRALGCLVTRACGT
jgi:hypothetical protein